MSTATRTRTVTVPDAPVDRNAKRRAAATARREAEQFYDGWDTDHVAPLSRDEKVVIAHLRGWLHYGPLCRMCKVEAHVASITAQVSP